ncbi:MAG TPA: hypothetical protein GXX72_00860, partial [Clostridiaceae bacterium]|nr:hypothetical protein [Clostridiaceae bacterium]
RWLFLLRFESVIEPDTKAVEEETTGVEAAIEPDAKTIEEETTGVEAVIEPDTKAVEKETTGVEAAIEPNAKTVEEETTGVEAVIEPDTKADEKEEDSDQSAITEPISSDNVLEHNQLLSHWQKVLDQLIELGHIDILIMARSSHVSYDSSNWYLNFDSSMQAQYERCSMPDAIRLLSTLVSQEMEQSVAVIARFAQDEEVKSGATAEPEWLNRVRKVCQETDVPLKVEE